MADEVTGMFDTLLGDNDRGMPTVLKLATSGEPVTQRRVGSVIQIIKEQ